MFFILPLLFLFFCSVIMRCYLENWRAATLFAAILAATALTGITESLSLIHALSFYPLMISWLLLTAFAVLKAIPLWPNALSYPYVNFKMWLLSEKIFLGTIVFICTVSALTAITGIPNTWDSMTYHLPRVDHWIQDKTVGFYPTHILRQLYSNPWAEFAIAHARILGGGETSANFVQWTAMAGSLIGVSLIAGQLGANRTGQLMASVMAACLPMGILQSVSTQTDYVCAFWLTGFVFFLIETRRKLTLVNTLAAGLSLGLAFLTKGYSYIFAFPFLAWFMGVNVKQRCLKGLLGLLLMIVCAVSINMGQYARNTQSFGSPAWTHESLVNETFDLKVLWENTLRNMSIHLATPWRDVNENMTQILTRAAKFFGANINDPRATFGSEFTIVSVNRDEDYSGNFLHAILFVIVFILSWFYRGPKGKTGFYVCAVLFSFLLFCLIVRFQPWHSRFHLPLFILFCPVAGVVLEHFLKQKSIVLGAFLFLGSMPWLFLNNQHPWAGGYSIWRQPKPFQYFYKRPDLALPYVTIARYIKSIDCRQIGLIMGEDTWEHPWWVLLADKGVRIEHVEVGNRSASLKYPLGDFQPCALISFDNPALPLMMVDSSMYAPAAAIEVPGGIGKITVLLRKT